MTREDLKNYKYNQKWIKERLEYIEELKENVTRVTSTLSGMPKANRKVEDSMAEKIAILIDSLNEMLEKIVEADKKQKMIIEELDKVEQPYKLILEKVYIQGKSLVTVASEMNYSYIDICRKHGIALKKIDKLI